MRNERRHTGNSRTTDIEHDGHEGPDSIVPVLKSARPFASLPDEEIVALARTTRTIDVRAHRSVTTGERRGDSAMILLRGRAKRLLLSRRGEEFVLEIFGSGELFAEDVLVAAEREVPCIEALERCRVLLVPGVPARRAMQRCAAALKDLSCVLQDKLDRRSELIAALALPLGERVAWLLSRLAQQHGLVCGRGLSIRHGLSQRDLAATIGVSRESLNRHLAALVRKGRIEVHRREIVLREHEMLEQLWSDRISLRRGIDPVVASGRRQCPGMAGAFVA